MKLRAKEIAKILGVSPATVSLVLNEKPGVGEETRRKVLALMKERGYQPVSVPMQTAMENGTIQFVIYRKHGEAVGDTHFYAEIMEEMERQARNVGCTLRVVYVNERQDEIGRVTKMLIEEEPSGLILLATEMLWEDVVPFHEMGIPMVVLDNYLEGEEVNLVSIDNAQGIRSNLRWLRERGHESIGYLHSRVPIYNFEQRYRSFQEFEKSFGNSDADSWVYEIDAVEKEGYLELIQQYQKEQRPTALLADNDTIAISAIRALKAAGIRVPEDISVIGFDDMPFGEMVEPRLSTVHVYKKRMAEETLRLLRASIEGELQGSVRVLVGTSLVSRDSAGEGKEKR